MPPFIAVAPAISLPLGRAWAANSLNCTTYRQPGVHTRDGRQATCFLDPDGDLVVVVRDEATARIERVRVPLALAGRDAHFSPSLFIAGDGLLHVTGGAHASRVLYLRGPVDELARLAIVDDPALATEDRLSYPGFVETGTDLYLTYRRGIPGRSTWRARRWCAEAQGWAADSVGIVSGQGSGDLKAGVYINMPVRAFDGRVGFFHVWRSPSLPGDKAKVRNIGMDFFEYGFGEGRAFTHHGVELPVPVTPFVSERIAAVGWDADLSNQAGATRLPDGRPFGCARFAPPDHVSQIFVFWPDRSGAWRHHEVTRFTSTMRMIGKGTLHLPHSRPACAAQPDGRVLVLYRTAELGNRLVAVRLRPPDFDLSDAEHFTLVDADLGFYEPVVDVALCERAGRLAAYVQACGDRADSVGSDPVGSDAWLMEWALPG